MSLRSVLISLVAVVAILVWGTPVFRQTHWYKLHVADDTIFYRVKVGLSHKGQPIDFDVVVGCGVRVTEHRYDGASIDVSAWYSFVYAKAVPGSGTGWLNAPTHSLDRTQLEPWSNQVAPWVG